MKRRAVTPPELTMEALLSEINSLIVLAHTTHQAQRDPRDFWASGIYDPALRLVAEGYNRGMPATFTLAVIDECVRRGWVAKKPRSRPPPARS